MDSSRAMDKLPAGWKLKMHTLYLQARFGAWLHINPGIPPHQGFADWEGRLIVLPRHPTDWVAYTVFMHELGHIASPNQRHIARLHWGNEVDAWEWAKAHSLVWTKEMDDYRKFALGTYLPWKPTPPTLEEMNYALYLPPRTF